MRHMIDTPVGGWVTGVVGLTDPRFSLVRHLRRVGLLVRAAAVRAVRADATVISAGMSGDLEAAVEAGATHLRIGTALLGDRGPGVR